MTEPVEVYDSEIDRVLEIQEILRRRAAERSFNYLDFEREIRERFAEIGFVAQVSWRKWSLDGVVQDGAVPDVTLTGRCEPHEFDHDRQVHEVTSNILGLPGQEGVIRTDQGDVFRNFRAGNGHDHSHGHHHPH